MASESVSTRLTGLSATLEGIQTTLATFIDGTTDTQVQSISFALVDHLRRVGKDLDGIAAEVRKEG